MSTVIASEVFQAKTLTQLIQEYNIPEHVSALLLKHGEELLDKNILYEIIMQGITPEVIEALSIAPTTHYRNDVYFNLPECKKHIDLTQEMINANIVSKPMEGPYCPNCGGTNTSFGTKQTRSCDEGHTVYIFCYPCDREFRNPTNIRFPEKK